MPANAPISVARMARSYGCVIEGVGTGVVACGWRRPHYAKTSRGWQPLQPGAEMFPFAG